MIDYLFERQHFNINDIKYDVFAVLFFMLLLGMMFWSLCYSNWSFFEEKFCGIVSALISVDSVLLTATVTTLSILFSRKNNKAYHYRIIRMTVYTNVAFGLLLISIVLLSQLLGYSWLMCAAVGFQIPYFITVGTSLVVFLDPEWHDKVDHNIKKTNKKEEIIKCIKHKYRIFCDFLDSTYESDSYFSQVEMLDISSSDRRFLFKLYDSIRKLNIGKKIKQPSEMLSRLDAIMTSIMGKEDIIVNVNESPLL